MFIQKQTRAYRREYHFEDIIYSVIDTLSVIHTNWQLERQKLG